MSPKIETWNLDLLSISHPIQRQVLLNSASTEQVRYLYNCLQNIPYQEDKLRPFKRELAELTDRNSSSKRQKQILVQRGAGFLQVKSNFVIHLWLKSTMDIANVVLKFK